MYLSARLCVSGRPRVEVWRSEDNFVGLVPLPPRGFRVTEILSLGCKSPLPTEPPRRPPQNFLKPFKKHHMRQPEEANRTFGTVKDLKVSYL